VQARADSWVEVRNRQGGVLVERVLHAGDSWVVPDQPGLTLSTGNAGGLQILVNGTPAPALGVPGAIRRDVKLDAAALRPGG
jgi:cytoskeleton protein RodZ